jgi:hypothetical protein
MTYALKHPPFFKIKATKKTLKSATLNMLTVNFSTTAKLKLMLF